MHAALEERIAGPRRKLRAVRWGGKALRGSAKAGYVAGRGKERVRTITHRDRADSVTAVGFGGGLMIGGIIGFFLDPQQGRRRRHQARDRVLSVGRRGAHRAERRAMRSARGTRGRFARLLHRNGGEPELDDTSLADKVRSEALRDHEVPKGQVNVNVEHGTVVLRGQLASQEQIDHLIREAERVRGVRGVKSLLHTA
jgi:hyperosmotically inducible periplasmic protein